MSNLDSASEVVEREVDGRLTAGRGVESFSLLVSWARGVDCPSLDRGLVVPWDRGLVVDDLARGVALGEAERLRTRVGEGAESLGVSTTGGLDNGCDASVLASVSGFTSLSSIFLFSLST